MPGYFSPDGTPPPPRKLRSISQESSMAALSLGAGPLPHPLTENALSLSRGSTISTNSGAETDPHVGGAGQVDPKPKKKRVRIKTERRREQCRRNQARYRNKQKLSAIQLEDTVEQLRDEVEQLKQQHEALHRSPSSPSRSSSRPTPDELVIQLFHVFRFGLNVGHEASSLSPHRQPPALEHQVAFVTSTFDADLQVGDTHGRTLFLEQLRRFSTLFDALETTLVRIDHFTDPELIQTTFQLDLQVSTSTLRYVFPHLVRAEHHHIRWKLLGQRLRCAGSGVLVFNAQGLVSQINWSLDLVAAMQRVLSIEESAIALQHAQIEQDAFLLASGEDAPMRPVPLPHATGPSRSVSRDVALYAQDEGRWDEAAGASDFHVGAEDQFAMV